MSNVFDQAFAILLGHEGGYDATREDPGNWTGGAVGAGTLRGTKYGISAAAYPALDIADLTEADAAAIYQRDYWAPMHCDEMPPGLALLVFDAAVNNGLSAATEFLQYAVGTCVDGVFGAGTLAALRRAVASQAVAALCTEVLARRISYMAALPGWRNFGLGWARRLAALPFQAAGMAAA